MSSLRPDSAPRGSRVSWLLRSRSKRSRGWVRKLPGSTDDNRLLLRSSSSSNSSEEKFCGVTMRSRFLLRSNALVSIGMPSGTCTNRLRWHDTNAWAQSTRSGQGRRGRGSWNRRSGRRESPRAQENEREQHGHLQRENRDREIWYRWERWLHG